MIDVEKSVDEKKEWGLEQFQKLEIPEGTVLFENNMKNEYYGSRLIAIQGKLIK